MTPAEYEAAARRVAAMSPQQRAELDCAAALVQFELVKTDAEALRGYLDRSGKAGKSADARRVLALAVQAADMGTQAARELDALAALGLLGDARGHLLRVAGECIGLALGATKDRLSAAGKKGGAGRAAKYAALKAWALGQAAKMKGDDKGIARELMKRLPVELAQVSSDPERLMYDALRARRKPPAPYGRQVTRTG